MFSYHEYGYGVVSDFRDLADSFESKISLSGMWHSISISSIENPQPTQWSRQCSQIVLDRNQCSVGTQRSRNWSKGIYLIGIYCSYEISSFQTSLVSYLCQMPENLYGVTIQLRPRSWLAASLEEKKQDQTICVAFFRHCQPFIRYDITCFTMNTLWYIFYCNFNSLHPVRAPSESGPAVAYPPLPCRIWPSYG